MSRILLTLCFITLAAGCQSVLSFNQETTKEERIVVAQEEEKVQAAVLVASRAMQGPYAGTVIYITKFDVGHVGLILNRPTEVKLGDLFPEHEASKDVKGSVFFGGPNGLNMIFATVKSKTGFEKSIRLDKDVWLIMSGTQIDKVVETAPNSAKYFAGYVTWTQGQLAEELSRGFFHLMRPDSSLLFLEDTSNMYEQLIKTLEPAKQPGIAV